MDDHHSYHTMISPVPDGLSRPLWSVMIPTYNCAQYLRKTLSQVLAQAPGSDMMQIEVVDDHSTQDDPKTIVEELGQGRVEFYCQSENVGSIQNFQTCLERSRGRYIHLLHGDDYVLEGFYQKMQQAFTINPDIGAAFCRHIFMDESGHWQSISELLQPEPGVLDRWLERIVTRQYIQTPSVVVRREVYEQLGGFDRRLVYGEDWEMWVRIATRYPVWYEPQSLAVYRMHSASISGRRTRTGQNIRDIRRGTEIVQSYLTDYLPQPVIQQLIQENRGQTAQYALKTAQHLFFAEDLEGGMAQLQEALECSRSTTIVKQSKKILNQYRIYQLKKWLKQFL